MKCTSQLQQLKQQTNTRALTQFRLGKVSEHPFFQPVRRTLSITTLCLAWLCANGALWDAVQVFAWGKMMHDYSQVMPFKQAIAKTFDASASCEICVVVDDVKSQQSPQQVERSAEKVLLVCQTPETFLVSVPEFSWPGVIDCTGLSRTEEVPVRPPRV